MGGALQLPCRPAGLIPVQSVVVVCAFVCDTGLLKRIGISFRDLCVDLENYFGLNSPRN
jgi:hypothetical protein